MAITPSNLIEATIDDLAMGELSQQAETFAVCPVDAGTVLLECGNLGRSQLNVTTEP
jgi:hypothetical protein